MTFGTFLHFVTQILCAIQNSNSKNLPQIFVVYLDDHCRAQELNIGLSGTCEMEEIFHGWKYMSSKN
jgi:hypothetical protein